jgi:Ser/Thr protein kinase RdoA (MazF antagonist)
LTQELLTIAAARFGAAPGSLRLIRDFENFVYDVELSGRPAVLRVTHCSHRTRRELEAELDFVRFLSSRGEPVCAPIASLAGALVEAIGDQFFACVFERANGTEVNARDPALWTEQLFHAWGRTLARLHRAARDYEPEPGCPRRGHWFEQDFSTPNHFSDDDQDLSVRFSELIEELRSQAPDPARYGLIHADLHHGNFFTTPDAQISVFDFDDAAYHFFTYDLVIATMHLPTAVRPVERLPIATAIIAGYRQLEPSPPGFVEDFRRLLLLRDLQIYQLIHKKIAPEERDERWRVDVASMAERIRSASPLFELPRDI